MLQGKINCHFSKNSVNKLLIGGGHLDQLNRDLILFIVSKRRMG